MRMYDTCSSYLDEIHEVLSTGDATELSYYPILNTFIKKVAKEEFGKEVLVIQNPKRVYENEESIGLPDFIVKTKEGDIIGYIEAKDPIKINLIDILDSEQIVRYKQLPNWILTNFIDFTHFRESDDLASVSIADKKAIQEHEISKPSNVESLRGIIEEFLSFTIPYSYTAEALATELAKRTKILRQVAFEVIEIGTSNLDEIYEAFKKDLIKDLKQEEFTDMYSQTIAYGLFFARMEAGENDFLRDNAFSFIPISIPILRNLFYFLTGPNLPKSLEFIVDDMVEVLRKTDISNIMKQIKSEKWTDDPVIHFYETFLRVYDPDLRDRRGVFYTPVPVVSFIVQSIHEVLKKNFGISEGVSSRSVTILDPAAGTMSFIKKAIELCYHEYAKMGKKGIFDRLVKEHILKHFYAFELLVAPYAIGHFKINNHLHDLGYTLLPSERIPFYLTNTLDLRDVSEMQLLPYLSEENMAAKEVKEKTKILVICGNPPYSVSSMNKAEFIEDLMSTFKEDVRNERNIQPLSDDYIKFLRFAQWKIEQSGKGVVGMITNNSYLDGIIHRGMRKKLMNSFDIIYILNLHGSARKKELAPEGKKDENVFDIQQGVCITILVKLNNVSNACQVLYADLWGNREEKYSFLDQNNLLTTEFSRIVPDEPYYFFTPKVEHEYASNSVSLDDIFHKTSTGVKTHRDGFIVNQSKKDLIQKLELFGSSLSENSDDFIKEKFKLKESDDWKLSSARDELRSQGIINEKIRKYNYRPFDIRWIYHSSTLVTRPRGELLEQISDKNMALVTTRQIASPPYNHVFVTNELPDICLISLVTKESSYIFPLYFKEKGMLKSNINENIVNSLKRHYGQDVHATEVFYYIYATLYSNLYRNSNEPSLMIDFPKISFTASIDKFKKLSQYGKELVDLQLFLNVSNKILTTYPAKGSDIVQRITFDQKKKRIYVNEGQYFSNITKEIWDYKIGSFQVLKKWIESKINHQLSIDEIDTFQKIVNIIVHSLDIQSRIDKIYEKAITKTIPIDNGHTQLEII
jgi:predicted helicase